MQTGGVLGVFALLVRLVTDQIVVIVAALHHHAVLAVVLMDPIGGVMVAFAPIFLLLLSVVMVLIL